jgi:hypothetical protein
MSSGAATGSSIKKKKYSDLLDKINGMWTNAKLFDKGNKLFSDDLQLILSKHLLKTICTDIVNLVFKIFSTDCCLPSSDGTDFTLEMRAKILSMLPENEVKKILTKLHNSLNGKVVEDCFTQLDTICSLGAQFEIGLKKPDKKRERQLIFNHRQSLAEQLRAETNAAMSLHMSVVLLVQKFNQCMIHAPGRCVPQIIEYLKKYLSIEEHDLLTQCQDLVVKQLKLVNEENAAGNDDLSSSLENTEIQLHEIVTKVKVIALAAKKSESQPSNVGILE